MIQQVDSAAVSEIDDIFVRWESQIAVSEMRAQIGNECEDELSLELATQEEAAELKEQLRLLVADSPAE